MKRFPLLSLIMAAVLSGLLTPSCSSRQHRGADWDTGNASADSLLRRIDSLECSDHYDEALCRTEYRRLDSLGRSISGKTGFVMRAYAQSALAQLDSNDLQAFHLDSMALQMTDSAAAPYLYNRLLLDRANCTTQLPRRTHAYFNLLPYFITRRDSLRVVNILYCLNEVYGGIWDWRTQTEYLREGRRYVPDSCTTLRAVMDFNIIATQRADSLNNGRYRRALDSIRPHLTPELLNIVPALGSRYYTDLYILTAHGPYLDSAAIYIAQATPGMSTKSYYAQRLEQSVRNNDPESGAPFAELLEKDLNGTAPMGIEVLPFLRKYYRMTGDSEALARTDSIYDVISARMRASEVASEMSRLNARQHIEEIRGLGDAQIGGIPWHVIASVVVGALAVAGAILWGLRRRQGRFHRELNNQLEETRRRLTVAELQQMEHEQNLSSMLQRLGNTTTDSAARLRSMLRVHLSGEDDWERFRAVFLEMRPGFDEKLRHDFPSLTRGDIRLCTLLTMDMDTKHIARILAIRPESVKKHRQRLRAKLGLDPDASLTDFLASY